MVKSSSNSAATVVSCSPLPPSASDDVATMLELASDVIATLPNDGKIDDDDNDDDDDCKLGSVVADQQR